MYCNSPIANIDRPYLWHGNSLYGYYSKYAQYHTAEQKTASSFHPCELREPRVFHWHGTLILTRFSVSLSVVVRKSWRLFYQVNSYVKDYFRWSRVWNDGGWIPWRDTMCQVLTLRAHKSWKDFMRLSLKMHGASYKFRVQRILLHFIFRSVCSVTVESGSATRCDPVHHIRCRVASLWELGFCSVWKCVHKSTYCFTMWRLTCNQIELGPTRHLTGMHSYWFGSSRVKECCWVVRPAVFYVSSFQILITIIRWECAYGISVSCHALRAIKPVDIVSTRAERNVYRGTHFHSCP